MTAFRGSTVGLAAIALLLAIVALWAGKAAAAPADLHKLCSQVKNDDTVRPYQHALHAGTVKAFKELFPDAKGMPQEAELETQANYRCMDGKLLACFVGANLPCAKMNAARDNPGADEFCKTNANADSVPAFATGHDAVYAYKCEGGKAVVSGTNWLLDKRGFATKLWVEVPKR
ncbi:hypothetical protein FJ987_22915 [Mesorhizobium sp. CU2]|uniref:hypothetical protein n=1 Tax=unclassified Mesorhizobium TaxID=325217 RepID=UPI00112C7428|nr:MULTISPECIES: hypothetical protein [unclassified Mesorhizobium]TPN75973.1 hypothetical protein FJ988_28655 [Mesorhizobium sp. CU3]TPO08856.1 hypothetical protein FJ987_22915 [Mesorhizobium sp. CU2]